MSPFQESETFPRGRRLLLVPVALIFLLGPYGSMLGGGPSDPLRWVVAMVSIAICTAILALGLAPPQRRVVVDPAEGTVRISSTPPPPHFLQLHEYRAIDDVTSVDIHEVGIAKTSSHGYRVVVSFKNDPPLYLSVRRHFEDAQRLVDHLVFLGLPGQSRAAAREAALSAENPTTWL